MYGTERGRVLNESQVARGRRSLVLASGPAAHESKLRTRGLSGSLVVIIVDHFRIALAGRRIPVSRYTNYHESVAAKVDTTPH